MNESDDLKEGVGEDGLVVTRGEEDGEYVFSLADQGPRLVPYFGYRDAAAMMVFLDEAFGFETLARYDGPDGAVMHAEMHAGPAIVMLGSLPPEAPANDGSAHVGTHNTGTYMVVDDVDAHHARATAAGAVELDPPADTPFGTRRYRVADPEGFEWSFGSYQPQLTG